MCLGELQAVAIPRERLIKDPEPATQQSQDARPLRQEPQNLSRAQQQQQQQQMHQQRMSAVEGLARAHQQQQYHSHSQHQHSSYHQRTQSPKPFETPTVKTVVSTKKSHSQTQSQKSHQHYWDQLQRIFHSEKFKKEKEEEKLVRFVNTPQCHAWLLKNSDELWETMRVNGDTSIESVKKGVTRALKSHNFHKPNDLPKSSPIFTYVFQAPSENSPSDDAEYVLRTRQKVHQIQMLVAHQQREVLARYQSSVQSVIDFMNRKQMELRDFCDMQSQQLHHLLMDLEDHSSNSSSSSSSINAARTTSSHDSSSSPSSDLEPQSPTTSHVASLLCAHPFQTPNFYSQPSPSSYHALPHQVPPHHPHHPHHHGAHSPPSLPSLPASASYESNFMKRTLPPISSDRQGSSSKAL
eukprot:TRINITY_DN3271_c0_g1_i1.p1 TRINITY_DN3271_c0_g1~~TRINITY_DN3271_c0_g1_i1.p1  ORF type:complete len:409 (+),score=161.12 TRINITY_DN3271_c0_g1_i1:480-1706(+)